jgi:hypothetical protein
MTDDLWRLDATELARLIRLGRVSSREATESCRRHHHQGITLCEGQPPPEQQIALRECSQDALDVDERF